MGVTINGSGTITSSTGSISFDDENLTTTGTIPAAQLTVQVPSANLNNAPDIAPDLRLLALQNAADRIDLTNGIADPYTDETDVDTSTSTNEIYSAATNSYNGESLSGYDATNLMTTGSSVIGAADAQNLTNLVDGDAATKAGMGSAFNGNSGNETNSFLGYDFGGSPKHIRKVVVKTVSAGDEQGATADIDWSDDLATWTTVASGVALPGASATGTYTTDIAASGAHRYWRVRLASETAITGTGSWTLSEMEMYEGSYAYTNVTLVSNSFTATSAPSNAIIGVQAVENVSSTINTDLTAEVSRDGGTTFTSCTLALKTNFQATNTKYYESASTDISGQPSGTSMKYRFKTLNTKNIEIHGAVLKWS